MDDKVKAKIMSFFKSVNVSKSFSLQWNNFQKKCEFSQKCQFFKILWVPYWSGSYKFDVSDILYTDLWCPKVQYCLFSKMTSSSPVNSLLPPSVLVLYELSHGLRTPNEGINQRYLKNWAEVADKICFGRT